MELLETLKFRTGRYYLFYYYSIEERDLSWIDNYTINLIVCNHYSIQNHCLGRTGEGLSITYGNNTFTWRYPIHRVRNNWRIYRTHF